MLRGYGDGTFQWSCFFTAASRPVSLAMGDFNGDGVPDAAMANGYYVVVLPGERQCGLPPAFFPAGSGPRSVVVGDFNRDGILDLAVANAASNNVSVLLGNSDGTFQAALSFDVGDAPSSVGVGDFNGDGLPDLAIANTGSDSVSVLINNTPR